MKNLLLASIFSLLLFCSATAQQQGVIITKIVESKGQTGLPGAIVSVTASGSNKPIKVLTSGQNGKAIIEELNYGKYLINVAYLGYDTISRKVIVDRAQVNISDIELNEVSHQIGKVISKGHIMRTSQRGDTIVYNADAFKIARDADADGLLQKMPGITITDGVVEAQGEEVKQIMVDGKEFFGKDVQTAIKNLPAESIESVEVFNKLSDNAQFTGIDDGEGHKAINIRTRATHKTGVFGKVSGEYGYEDKYYVGGSVNFFSPNHKVTLLGMVNNISIQNFNFEDILSASGGGRKGRHNSSSSMMVGNQQGISEVGAVGLNYTGTLSKKFNLNLSYFFNTTDNHNEELIDRQYFGDEESQRLYESTNNTTADNLNHKLNLKLDYEINENQSMMLRSSVSLQNNISTYDKYAENIGLNTLDDYGDLDKNGYNINNTLIYRLKLGKVGRTLTAFGGVTSSDNNNENYTESILTKFNSPIDDIVKQNILQDKQDLSIRAGTTYTEPLTTNSQLSLRYRYQYSYSDIDKQTYEWLENNSVYDYVPNNDLSTVYNSSYSVQQIGPGFNYGKDGVTLVGNVAYQRSSLINNQTTPTILDNDYNFNNITYFSMLNYPINKTNTLRIFLYSRTGNPSITELLDVMDISNPLYVSKGNPDLTPSYNNSFRASYTRSNIAKGQSIMLSLGANIIQNNINDNTTIMGADGGEINGETLAPFAEYSTYENMDGKWTAWAMVNFGTPISFIKSNLNLHAKLNIGEDPNMLGGLDNTMLSQYISAGATLSSNISENVDFTLSYNGNYGVSTYSNTSNNTNDNEYLTHKMSANIKAVMWKGFTFTANGSYNIVNTISIDEKEDYLIANAFIGKKVFKSQLGEIMVGVYDIFDQQSSYKNTITNLYSQIEQNSTLGRYYGLKFIYSIRSFKGNPPTGNSGYKGDTLPSMHKRGGGGGRM